MKRVGSATVTALIEAFVVILIGAPPAYLIHRLWPMAFKSPAPDWIVILLGVLCLAAWIPSALFRFGFDGEKSFAYIGVKPVSKPLHYEEICRRLQTPALTGFFLAIDIAFYGLRSMRAGVLLFVIYAATEETIVIVANRRRKRVWEALMHHAKHTWPESPPDQQIRFAQQLYMTEMREEWPESAAGCS